MRRIIIALSLSVFIFPQLAHAGAWTLPKKKTWIEVSTKGSWNKRSFDADRELRGNKFDAQSVGLTLIPKVEYGLTDKVTLMTGMQYKDFEYKEYSRPQEWGPYRRRSSDITEMEVGTRVRLLEKPFVASAQIKGMFYSGNGQKDEPGLSDGNDTLELRALVGKTFDRFFYFKTPCYVGLEAGYWFNNRRVCNQIPLFAEAGIWPKSWLLFKGELDGILCQDGTGKVEKDYMIWRLGPAIELLEIYELMRNRKADKEYSVANSITHQGRSLLLSATYGQTFSGRNTGADNEVTVKISTQF
ncbi:MAG: hypothetical protein HQL28_03985 [Candidatus Omnitrophica bacterium]|nr:hypothetical protein [Candidatus Omnitrophota bacterium]